MRHLFFRVNLPKEWPSAVMEKLFSLVLCGPISVEKNVISYTAAKTALGGVARGMSNELSASD